MHHLWGSSFIISNVLLQIFAHPKRQTAYKMNTLLGDQSPNSPVLDPPYPGISTPSHRPPLVVMRIQLMNHLHEYHGGYTFQYKKQIQVPTKSTTRHSVLSPWKLGDYIVPQLVYIANYINMHGKAEVCWYYLHFHKRTCTHAYLHSHTC